MKIVLKSLELINFKGIKHQQFNFYSDITNVKGRNATGKTTMLDAFLWVLFGKDSHNRTDFEVKTLDHRGVVIEKLDHEVIAVFDIDGEEMVIRRVLREKWEKKRGTLEPQFTGNETLYYWNDVPMQQKQFQEKINSLVNENVFKLITNTNYFNSLKWQERRQVLISIAGEVSDQDILDKVATIENKQQLFELTNALNSRKTITEYKAEIAAKKKKLKDDLATIPTRIDEVNRNKPEPQDYALLEKEIAALENELKEIDATILDEVRARKEQNDERLKKQNEIYNLQSSVQSITNTIKSKFAQDKIKRESEISNLQYQARLKHTERNNLVSTISGATSRLQRQTQEKNELADQWAAVNAAVFHFDEESCVCPTCLRKLEAGDIETQREKLLANFNTEKQRKIVSITEKGYEIKREIESLELSLKEQQEKENRLFTEIQEIENQLSTLQNQHQAILQNEEREVKTLIETNEEIKQCEQRIAELQAEIEQPTAATSTDYSQKKSLIQSQINNRRTLLSVKDQIEAADKRVDELVQQESSLAQQLADLEKTEFVMQQFTKARIDALESRINSRFKTVRFKLFDTQINGGEVECCETLVNSNGSFVPFSDANNAAKINAGLDIINTLCDHYKVCAPIFIDNRESVNKLIPCDSQIINLIVSNDATLRIDAPVEALEAVA